MYIMYIVTISGKGHISQAFRTEHYDYWAGDFVNPSECVWLVPGTMSEDRTPPTREE
jgi:hypothetical protein